MQPKPVELSWPFFNIFSQTLLLFLLTFLFFVIILYKTQSIASQESSIAILQELILAQLDSITFDLTHHLCVTPENWPAINASNQEYCDNSLSIGNYSTNSLIYVDWIPTLQDKIDRGYISYDTICLNTLVIHTLVNNPNTTWPVTSSFPGDTFLNGLPNICLPGTNIGHSGISTPFQDLVFSFLSNQTELTDVPPLRSILFFPATSIPATVGTTFYTNNSIIQCYQTELYCYGFIPMYLFTVTM